MRGVTHVNHPRNRLVLSNHGDPLLLFHPLACLPNTKLSNGLSVNVTRLLRLPSPVASLDHPNLRKERSLPPALETCAGMSHLRSGLSWGTRNISGKIFNFCPMLLPVVFIINHEIVSCVVMEIQENQYFKKTFKIEQ